MPNDRAELHGKKAYDGVEEPMADFFFNHPLGTILAAYVARFFLVVIPRFFPFAFLDGTARPGKSGRSVQAAPRPNVVGIYAFACQPLRISRNTCRQRAVCLILVCPVPPVFELTLYFAVVFARAPNTQRQHHPQNPPTPTDRGAQLAFSAAGFCAYAESSAINWGWLRNGHFYNAPNCITCLKSRHFLQQNKPYPIS